MPVFVARRQAIVALLTDGHESQEIAVRVGVTPGPVAAAKAHITMGSYGDTSRAAEIEAEVANAADTLRSGLSATFRWL